MASSQPWGHQLARRAWFRGVSGPSWSRPPAIATTAMVASGQPVATRAGIRALERGGNAVDAALAAAAVLCVAEPMSTGIGGDMFAVIWDGARARGLDAAGPAPSALDGKLADEERGPKTVTVPGALRGWVELSRSHGRLGLDSLLADAIDAAEQGVAVGPATARAWADAGMLPELGSLPRLGDLFLFPALANTLRKIADEGDDALYRGRIAESIASVSFVGLDDLEQYQAKWVEPLTLDYRGITICELPPPTQGAVALEALGLLELGMPTLPLQIQAVRLALEDGFKYIRDGEDVTWLLETDHLTARARETPEPVTEPSAGTVYVCAVDRDGMAVSLIQSLYRYFGSRIVVPGTGIVLQNRGRCFAISGQIQGKRRPYHTTIPGLLLINGKLLGAFGIVGGFMQAQAHLQFVSALVDDELDVQASLDRNRFRIEGDVVRLEGGLFEASRRLVEDALNLAVVEGADPFQFGAGQAIIRRGDVLLGGVDRRRDGLALGL